MVFLVLCDHMTFANGHDCGQTFDKDEILEDVATYAGIKDRVALYRCLKDLCDTGVLYKESNSIYRVNPHYAYKGDGKLAQDIWRRWDMLYPLPNSKYYNDLPFY